MADKSRGHAGVRPGANYEVNREYKVRQRIDNADARRCIGKMERALASCALYLCRFLPRGDLIYAIRLNHGSKENPL